MWFGWEFALVWDKIDVALSQRFSFFSTIFASHLFPHPCTAFSFSTSTNSFGWYSHNVNRNEAIVRRKWTANIANIVEWEMNWRCEYNKRHSIESMRRLYFRAYIYIELALSMYVYVSNLWECPKAFQMVRCMGSSVSHGYIVMNIYRKYNKRFQSNDKFAILLHRSSESMAFFPSLSTLSHRYTLLHHIGE